jgi:hypothetical protein
MIDPIVFVEHISPLIDSIINIINNADNNYSCPDEIEPQQMFIWTDVKMVIVQIQCYFCTICGNYLFSQTIHELEHANEQTNVHNKILCYCNHDNNCNDDSHNNNCNVNSHDNNCNNNNVDNNNSHDNNCNDDYSDNDINDDYNDYIDINDYY